MKKGDFNFVWLFAILAGSAILVLMIYAAVRTGTTIKFYQDTELTKQVSVFLDPMQAGFVSSSKGVLSSKREIVFDSFCDSSNFGYQKLSAKQIRGLNEDFNILGEEITIKDKYIYFSKEPSKKFYFFSIPINFGFKVTDVLIIDSREFCFLEGYEDLPSFKTHISVLGDKAIFGEDNCTKNSIKVCFNYGTKCDITIISDCIESWCDDKYEKGFVIKEGERIDYVGNFLYPAIFSDKEIYECNLKRILYKAGVLSLIYKEKSERMSSRNCPTNLEDTLIELRNVCFNSKNIDEIYSISKLLKELEERTQCKLWSE